MDIFATAVLLLKGGRFFLTFTTAVLLLKGGRFFLTFNPLSFENPWVLLND